MWAPIYCWIFDFSQDSPQTFNLTRADVEEPPAPGDLLKGRKYQMDLMMAASPRLPQQERRQKILEIMCASQGRARQYQSPCIWHVDGRLHFTAKWKQSILREVFEWLGRPLETYKARNDGNCRDHWSSSSQMACKNQTAIRCKLSIMQKGTRTTRCEHWKFAGRDVWAHQQCFLRWNGDNRHCCPPLHLETSVCQHASCTNTNE